MLGRPTVNPPCSIAPATGAHGRRAASSTPPQPSGPARSSIDVQAHTLWVESAPGKDTFIDAETVNPDFTYKREGGQLLLIYIPATIPA